MNITVSIVGTLGATLIAQIDDSSPLWTWASGQWYDDHSNDGGTDLYFQESFHSTFGKVRFLPSQMRGELKGKNAGASITFRGTAVYVYGCKNNNHAGIDYDSPVTMSGYSATRAFQQLLWSATDLSADTDHTLTMTNLPALTDGYDGVSDYWLDIDYVVITAPVPSSVQTTTYDDSQTSVFTFSSGDWTPETTWQAYSQDTAHLGFADGATMEFTFYGHSVELVGGVNTDHGNYSVSLDGGTPTMYNGTRFAQMTYVSLFVASGLEEAQHKVTMTNHAVSASEHMMDVDYAVVNSTAGSQTSSLASSMPSSSGATSAADTAQGTSSAAALVTVSDGLTVSPTSTSTAQQLQQTAYPMVVGAAGSPELKAQPLPAVDTALGADASQGASLSGTARKAVIVCGCAGLLALLLLALGGVWRWHRRRVASRSRRTWSKEPPHRFLAARDDIDELTPLSARWDKAHATGVTEASPYPVDSHDTYEWLDTVQVCRATKVRAMTAPAVTIHTSLS